MKRKIGLIIAVVFTVALSLFASKSVSATGANGDIYCSITYGDKAAKYKQCAYVLLTYHKDELKEWGCSELSKTNTTPSDLCRARLLGHIKYNISKCTSKGGKYTTYNCASSIANGVASRIAKDEKSKGKAGMSLDGKCYTTEHEKDTECDPSDEGDGGDSGSGNGKYDTKVDGGDPEKCTTLLPSSACKGANGIASVLTFIIGVLTGSVVVAGTVGIVICGLMIMTARDDEEKLRKGKKRLLEVVIGMIAWILMSVLVNLFIPKTSESVDKGLNDTGVIKIENEEEKA